MKKFLMFLMAAALLFGACKDKEKQQYVIDVESVVQADHEYMSDNYDCDYVWYEASMVLKDYIDAEDFDGTVMSLTDIFQIVPSDSTMSKSLVVMIEHTGELMAVKEVHGLWVEDVAMTPGEITYTYSQAWEKLMATECIKPHSKFCVLRHPLGPYQCNPQYIFGDAHGDILLFLDAVTGDVRNENPAFNPIE